MNDGRVGTIDEIETYLLELCGFEQGLMIQNIALAAEALGLGGFPHYGAHRFGWTRAFGFRMHERTFAEVLHKGFLGTLLMKLMGKNVSIPQAVGIDHDGQPIWKPWTTPYYPTMEAAVRAFVDYKFAPGTGIFRTRRPEPVARSGRDPVDDPAVPRGEHPGGHRLLRVRPQALRPIPGQVRAVPDADGVPGPPHRHGLLRPVLPRGRLHRAHARHFARWHPGDAIRTVTGAHPRPSSRRGCPTTCTRSRTAGPTIDGNLVHYIDEGTGPPLLLLNGNPSWSFGWRDVVLGLRERFRCIAVDYPGFGLSRRRPAMTSGRASHSRGR